MISFYDRVHQLTRDIVRIPSINRAPDGETAVAAYIRDFYAALPYFQRHPERLSMHPTTDDSIDRHNVMAWVRGTKGSSKRAVLLLGHIDTVGVDDYGPIGDRAFDPDALPNALRTLELPDEVLQDIESGEFLFGRGALDMKSGVAGHMALMEYFAAHPDQLDGTLIALHECDEESGARGVQTGIEHLIQLKRAEGLDYIACINADYSTNHFPGDENRYLYYGCVGKQLPCFYVFGKEAHVGQAFSAFDPNLLVSRITCDLSLNVDFSDVAEGEVAVPPISLRLSDTKEGYTVQTALSALAYFNLFTHRSLPDEVLEKCRRLAEGSFDAVIEGLNRQYRRFCEKSGMPFTALPWRSRVMTWDEFYRALLAEHGAPFAEALRTFANRLHRAEPELDMREFSRRVIDEAWNWAADKSPLVVIFLGSVFHTHSSVTRDDPRGERLLDAVEQAVREVAPTVKRSIKTRMFYPYIADTSFLVAPKVDVTDTLRRNMPSWGYHFTHDRAVVAEVDMPVVNIGSFGRDGHMLTERVDMAHSFGDIPAISYRAIRALLD